MTRDEFLRRLDGYEWSDIEFKEAAWAVPKNALETVSAFANTTGGILVFGVKEVNTAFEISGVTDPDRIQNTFLGWLKDPHKLSSPIVAGAQLLSFPEGAVLIFTIPEAARRDKPICINGNPQQAYVRRASRDEKCSPDDMARFLRDAAAVRYDSEPLRNLNAETFYDAESVKWYRQIFHARNPGKDETASPVEFLHEWGFVVEDGNRLVPTRAAALIFGTGSAVRQVLPRPVVDYQFLYEDADSWTPDRRWDDRRVVEDNLIVAWRTLVDRYRAHADQPFQIDPATLRRSDDPPDYISFREATINLLIHQDFGDHTRKASIKNFRDQVVFWNPGDAFANTEQLLDPTEKEIRNPAVVAAFRRIGLSDQAGSGVRSIFANWQRLGHVPPEIHNHKADKAFELRLRREPLVSDEQRLILDRIGAHLDEASAKVVAYALREDSITLTDVKGLTGLSGPRARELIQRLVTVQVLLKPVVEGGNLYTLADHLRSLVPAVVAGKSYSDQSVTYHAAGYPLKPGQLVISMEVIAKFQKAQDFFSEAEDKKEVLVCKIR